MVGKQWIESGFAVARATKENHVRTGMQVKIVLRMDHSPRTPTMSNIVVVVLHHQPTVQSTAPRRKKMMESFAQKTEK